MPQDKCPHCGGELVQTDKNTFTGVVWREYTCRTCGHIVDVNEGEALWKVLHDAAEQSNREKPVTIKMNYRSLIGIPILIGLAVLLLVTIVVAILRYLFLVDTSRYGAIFGYSTFGLIIFLSTLKNKHARISHLGFMCAIIVFGPLVIFSLLDMITAHNDNTSLLSWIYLFMSAFSFSIILKYIFTRLSK